MRIVVLGATGHIGSAIVHELTTRGHKVFGTGRRTSPPKNLQEVDFTYLRGDIDTDGQLDAWIQGSDIVVDAAAPYGLNLLIGKSDVDKRPLHYAQARTDRLLTALRKHNAQLIYISSSVTERPDDNASLATLQSKVVRKIYPYFQVKKLIEDRILEATTSGLRAVILRPTSCVGPWDAKPRELCWIPKLLCGEIPAVLRHKINVVDTRDLACVLATVLEGDHDGEKITVSGHNTTTDEFLSQLCKSGGVAAPAWGFPAAFSIVPLLCAEAMWASIGSTSPFPSLVSTLLCEQRWVEPDGAQQQLNISIRPLADTARDTVRWYRDIGYC